MNIRWISFALTFLMLRVSAVHADNAPPTFIPATRGMFTPLYYALSHRLPVEEAITFDRIYALPGVAVEYKYEIFIDGAARFSATGGPLKCIIPDSDKDKQATMVVSIRKEGSTQFTSAESLRVAVSPRALFTTVANATIRAGDPLRILVLQGINPNMPLPKGTKVRFVDDQGGSFFNVEVPASSGELAIPMRPHASVSRPTIITVHISTEDTLQVCDDMTLYIVPRKPTDEMGRYGAELNKTPLMDFDFKKTVIGALSNNECTQLARGAQEALRGLRTRRAERDTQPVAIDRATCLAVHMRDSVAIERVQLSSCINLTTSRVTLDKKTGTSMLRTMVAHTFEQDHDLKGAALDAFLKTIVSDGPYRGKTVAEELRDGENVR